MSKQALTLVALALVSLTALARPVSHDGHDEADGPLPLGAFSVSLAVKDLAASRAFYETLDFEQVAGDPTQNWIVLQNGTTTIGLFQGMFERNIMTFNPGWTPDQETLEHFADVRTIQKRLKAAGIDLTVEADENSTGPASVMIADPDGNPILFDQHVASPKD